MDSKVSNAQPTKISSNKHGRSHLIPVIEKEVETQKGTKIVYQEHKNITNKKARIAKVQDLELIIDASIAEAAEANGAEMMRQDTQRSFFEGAVPPVIYLHDIPVFRQEDVLRYIDELGSEQTSWTRKQCEAKARKHLSLLWHPDRFENRFGKALCGQQKAQIMAMVNETQQLILRLCSGDSM